MQRPKVIKYHYRILDFFTKTTTLAQRQTFKTNQ